MKELFQKNKVKVIIGLGAVLRLMYVLMSKVAENRQYDLGPTPPDMTNPVGHLGYIFYIFTEKKIPQFDPREVYQFFHPPVHHILEAIWLSIVSLFTDDVLTMIEWLQVPTLIYSVLILIVCLYICKALHLPERATEVVLAIMAFHPSFVFMAASINNDGLMFLFQFLIILCTLNWYTNRSNKNIVLIAIVIGLGMLTKLSAGLLAVPVAFLYLYVFITECKAEKKFAVKRFWQYVLFGIICVPLGLSWAIRCLIKFDMPLNYTHTLSEDSWQYVGDYSLLERFFIPNPVTLLGNLKNGGIGMGENTWIQLFRTAALGECDLSEFPMWGKLVALLMICVAAFIAILAFVYFVKFIFVKDYQKETGHEKVLFIFFWIAYIVMMAFYLSFIYNYPFECTMNFRYILPTVFLPAVFLGMGYEKAGKKMSLVIKTSVWAYCLVSIMTVLVWCIS